MRSRVVPVLCLAFAIFAPSSAAAQFPETCGVNTAGVRLCVQKIQNAEVRRYYDRRRNLYRIEAFVPNGSSSATLIGAMALAIAPASPSLSPDQRGSAAEKLLRNVDAPSKIAIGEYEWSAKNFQMDSSLSASDRPLTVR